MSTETPKLLLRDWTDLLGQMLTDLARLEVGLVVIRQEMAELEAAGMFPAVPTELWETRTNTQHGEARYLRLGFSTGALPGGRRKLYIGCDLKKITRARQMASRRLRWEALEAERVKLERFLRMTRSVLEREAGSVSRYEIPEELGLELGPVAAGGDVSAGPKELPPESAPEWIRTRPQMEWNLDVKGEVVE